ncbi:putative lipoprotein [Flavobacterium cauense R2A-7]|uniref:Uncharacterized protein DUF4136 n=1 Tax=Flavobacterium cauense R2A-7 TaxID=1341154 RepID=V6RYJ0_9FLAO|nr:DUF4136 domain-containing protein [Flavobacterium cauense]ESU19518.1 putative lipoprotein [Flavobacterium cauense R2A-7]KGO84051.1 lipoprotein [Flavobacterium cauense R2A-7]TWI14606.1 uncharacterized protein DUF4136 [Flavobacterium cauense R2A-7]
MKTLKLLSLTLLFILGACSTVRVDADYDNNVDFSQFKTYAYQKSGIDKAEISDLDKKRILRAIDTQMQAKGYTKSETPDLLVNIFTKERERVDVNQYSAGWGYGWGWGWNPYMWGGRNYVTTSTEGTLYIDLIDAKKKELIWQGKGSGYLEQSREKKEERINEFVSKILAQFPPEKKQ